MILGTLELLEVNQMNDCCGDNACCRDGNAQSIESGLRLTSSDAAFLEGLQTQVGQMERLSAIAPRGFSGAHLSGLTHRETLNFRGVNRTSVVATWSGSRPGVGGFSIDLDAHGVFGFERLNLIPTHSHTEEGVGNDQPFVEILDLGANEKQVGAIAHQDAQSDSNEAGLQRAGHDGLNDQDPREAESYNRRDPNGSRTKEVGVGHLPIFSQSSNVKGLETV